MSKSAADDRYVIVNVSEPNLVWSNELGWVAECDYTVFTEKQTKSLNLLPSGKYVPEKDYIERPRQFKVEISGNPTRAEDEDVPGVYLIEVAGALPEKQHYDAVMDALHNSVAIELLEDFSFNVLDWEEESLLSRGSPDHVNSSLLHATRFLGRVQPAPEIDAPSGSGMVPW